MKTRIRDLVRSELSYYWYSLVTRRAGLSIWRCELYDLVTSEMQLHLLVWLPGGTHHLTTNTRSLNLKFWQLSLYWFWYGCWQERAKGSSRLGVWVLETDGVLCCLLLQGLGAGGVPTLPTRPYVVLELCHCATSVSSLEKLSSHRAAHLPSPRSPDNVSRIRTQWDV